MSLEQAKESMPLCDAARGVEDLMAILREKLEVSEDQQGVDKRLKRAAYSVQAEYEHLRRHLDREDDEQVILSMERLLRKIVRFQRRF